MLAPGGVCPDLCDALEAGGPYGAGWPAPRVAAGPVRIVKADVVGNGHLRLIVAGDDGRRIKAIAFRMAESALGQAMLAAPPHRRLWIAGRIKRDDWGDRARGRAPPRGRRLGRLSADRLDRRREWLTSAASLSPAVASSRPLGPFV